MRIKKKTGPEKTPEQLALERSVDAIMDPKRPDETSATQAVTASLPSAEKAGVKLPVVAIPVSKDTKTAPKLSAELTKQIAVADVPTTPLSIDKLDALTESITEPETAAKPKAKDKPEAPATPKPEDSAEPASQDDITDKSTKLDDTKTDEAVDNIVAYESDVMLAVADSTAAERNRQVEEPSRPKGGHRTFSAIMWTLVVFVAILAVVFLVLLVTGGNLPGIRNV